MKLQQKIKLVAASSLLALVTGCSSTGMFKSGSALEGVNGANLSATQAENIQTVFYFSFDQSSVKASDRNALKVHGQYLAANPKVTVRLEGHADERGSREYNVALGEHRAKSAYSVLRAYGAKSKQVDLVSYGEEKPVMFGHGDKSWNKNRRVELKYKGK